MSPNEASKPVSGGRARASRWPVAASWIAAVLGVIAIGVAWLYLGAPGFVRSEILKTIAQRYHRTARLDRVRLDPLRLHAEFDGFYLPDRDGRSMLGFRQLNARLSWPSLLSGKIAFDELALDRPQIRVVRRPDGRINLADLVPPQKTKEKPLSLRVAHLRLTGGRADLVDAMRPQPFEKRFDRITFSLRNFSTTADGAAYSLSGESDAGERLSWRGVMGVAPLASKGRFSLAGWRAERLAELAPGALPFTLTSGLLDVQGDYDFALRGNILNLQADLDNAALKSIAIRANHAAGGLIRADALSVSGVHFDLGRRAVSVAHIVLSRPQLDVSRDPTGAINLAAFAPPPGASAAANGPAWAVSAADIRVERGEASIEDRAAPEPVAWSVDPVDVTVLGFAYPLAGPLQVQVHAEADDGSKLDVKGPLTLPSGAGGMPSGRFDVALVGIELNRFQPYIGEIAKVSVVGGDASARGQLDLSPSGDARFTGGLWVDSLHAVDPTLKSDLVTWDKLTATGVTASSKPFAVRIVHILADNAYGRVVLEPNYVFNIRAVLEQQGAPPPGVAALTLKSAPNPKSKPKKGPIVAPPTSSAPQINLPIDIERIDFINGRMDFTDLTVQPQFATGVQDINGDITGLSARAGVRAKVDLKGGVDPFAPVTISGTLDPFGPDRFLDMAMGFHNMELTTFSPYSGKFAGYRIERGKLDVDLRYHIENERIDAKHHVVINQLQLGEKVDSADATKLPVKLIVALLKDRNGVIDIPIDVTGSLDDPKFRIWPVIWKIVGNMFGKIASSPFTMLGHLGGHGGGEDIGKIVFQPGSAALAPSETDKISALAKALDQRPGLQLEIPETVAPDLDGPALAQAAYQDSLQVAYRVAFKRSGSPPLDKVEATPKLKLRLLETAYRQTYGQSPTGTEKAAEAGAKDRDAAAAGALETALQDHAKASDRAIAALAQARARAVETALVDTGHIDPKRIFLITMPPLKTAPIVMAVALK
ncbi:MAG TPA: DUF748 domain-containing protein [Caulobacteraceae bacterium]|jgi:uncharacterized protein involved in outer membrane biogenesis|nr:DUF748 domain-containing protein [Caulobacteraceae bacterium]